jgi:hypothetical protein
VVGAGRDGCRALSGQRHQLVVQRRQLGEPAARLREIAQTLRQVLDDRAAIDPAAGPAGRSRRADAP